MNANVRGISIKAEQEIMKVRSMVKKICDKCKIVHRKGVVRVIAKTQNINRGKG